MSEQNPREALLDILDGIERLMAETREARRELNELEQDVKALHEAGRTSALTFELDKQKIRRGHNKINDCIKSLERQKKIALWELGKLERQN